MNQIATLSDNQIKSASTQELKQHLAGSLEITAKHLGYMAMIWRELESRGEDLSELRHGIAAYLPMIAHGRVDANVVIKFAGQKTLLGALARLPIEEQRRIADTGYVALAKEEEDGELGVVETPLTRLSARDVYAVFGEDKVRTPAEQIRLIERRKAKPSVKPATRRKARRVLVDKKERVLLVSNTAADIDRVVEQLSDYYGVDIHELINKAKASTS